MLLTPRLFVLDLDSEEKTVLRKGPLPAPSICVVPRANCAFRRTRLVGSSRNALKAAQLKAQKEALPGEDGSIIVPDKGEEVASATAAPMAGLWSFAKHASHTGRYLPESLAQLPLARGARLVQGLSGFEGQIWIDKNIVASRWWPKSPAPQQWDTFMRAAQEELGPLSIPLPPAAKVPWRDDISGLSLDKDQIAHWISPRNIAAIMATALICGYTYIGGQYVRETLALSKAETQTASLSEETEMILSQRRRALANMRYARQYDSLGQNDELLQAISALSSVLGMSGLAIQRFSLRQNQIDTRLVGEEEISIPDAVSLLEAAPALSNVSVSLDAQGAVRVIADLDSAEPVNEAK